jgi:hypothetical protein
MAPGDVADGQIPEEWCQSFDAAAAAAHRARLQRVLDGLEPAVGEFDEADVPVLLGCEVPNLLSEFYEPASGQLAVCSAEGSTKLLVTPFDQSIMRPRWFATVRVFADVAAG